MVSVTDGFDRNSEQSQPVGEHCDDRSRDRTDCDDDPITIVGRRIEADRLYELTEIERSRLTNLPVPRLEYAIADVAGVQSFRRSDSRSANPSAQGLTLRGLGGNASSRTQVHRDGIPMEDPFFGFIPFISIPPINLENIAILKGAAVGSYGSGVAGRVDLTSTPLTPTRRQEGLLTGSDVGSVTFRGIMAGPMGSGAADISLAIDQGPGFWTTPADQRVEASVRSAYSARSMQARFAAPVATGRLTARFSAFRDGRTLRFRGADSQIQGIDGDLRYESGRWEASIFAKRRDFSNVVISSTRFLPVLDQYSTPATGIGASLSHALNRSLTLGVDTHTKSGEASERASSAFTGATTALRTNGGRSNTTGAYLQALGEFGPWRAAGTLRVDRWALGKARQVETDGEGNVLVDRSLPERSRWEWSGRVGAGWVHEGVRVRAAAYHTFRPPTLNELYRGFTVFPVVTLANPDLDSERLRGADVGIELAAGKRWTIGLTGFANRLDGAIANVTIAPDLRQRENIDAISTKGVEFALRAELRDWSIAGSASLLDPRVRSDDELDGLRPAQTPRFASSLTLERRMGRVGGSVTLRHVGKAFEEDLNQFVLRAATTVDVATHVRVADAVDLVLRVSNLLDEDVVTRNQAGSIDLAPGRELSIGFALAR